MKKIFSKIKFVYQYIINSIGFYPTLISLLFAALALLMLYLEGHGMSKHLKDRLPFMIITNEATARLILSSITTGVISLVVFSFTMVMLVLNQASANFSPRVIPGLISNESNQRILGLYLGTLVYTLIIMVNINSSYYSIPLPGFSIFLAMCFTIVCLAFFVYFIHAISQSIQIGSILESIHRATSNELREEIKQDKRRSPPNSYDPSGWFFIKSLRTGYWQTIDEEPLVGLCEEFGVVLDFDRPLGSFLIEGVPFVRINRKLPDEANFRERLFHHMDFFREERPVVNYHFGFKHITESAVKALSPGINDPGTAMQAIDYLTDLLALRMELGDQKVLYDAKGLARVHLMQPSFEEVLSLSLSPIRHYGKESTVIVLGLLYLLRNLLYKVVAYPHQKLYLYKETALLLQDAQAEIKNTGDREKINQSVQEINQLHVLHKRLPLLEMNG
ncbi:DUF2254 domain-containing protein [Pontibacter ummariensis]|nr:DUF2254 domain-containing protein [Pontibacter ummariensis]